MQTKTIAGLKCDFLAAPGAVKVAYMIYPDVESYFPEQWIRGLALKHRVAIVMIYVPGDCWDNWLTPWPAPGEPKGSAPFAGDAPKTLTVLQQEVIPQCEAAMGLTVEPSNRTLIGVSLAGLFTLWQWMMCDTFGSIGSLSGSFWYDGFLDWFNRRPLPAKSGKAYFLLGRQEPKAPVKAYRTVGVNTQAIYERFKQGGIDAEFQWVPGNHIANPLPRAEAAFDSLFPAE